MDSTKDTGTPQSEESKLPFTYAKIAEVYSKKAGNMSATAAALNIARRTLYYWRTNHPELDAMLKDVDEALLDFTESKLTEAINEGNLTAIIFHLKTKGKSRGYIEGQEITATVQSAKPMTQQEAQDFIQDLENKY